MFIEENDYGRGRFFRECEVAKQPQLTNRFRGSTPRIASQPRFVTAPAKKLSYGGYKINPCLSVAISFFVR